jgi:hypothetical protein
MGAVFYSILGAGLGIFVLCIIIAFALARPRRQVQSARRNSTAGLTGAERPLLGAHATRPPSTTVAPRSTARWPVHSSRGTHDHSR